MYKLFLVVLMVIIPACGKHYDCYNLGKYDKSIIGDVVDYCTSDRMNQYNSCGYGKQRDWKDGVCK